MGGVDDFETGVAAYRLEMAHKLVGSFILRHRQGDYYLELALVHSLHTDGILHLIPSVLVGNQGH